MKADQLILTKRIDIDATLVELENKNIVDSSFNNFVSEAGFEINFVSADQQFRMQEMLKVKVDTD